MDEDSGADYESSSNEEHGSSHEDGIERASSSRSGLVEGRSGLQGADIIRSGRKRVKSQSNDEDTRHLAGSQSPEGDERIRSEAIKWATTFQPPGSAGEIPFPKRHVPSSHSKRKEAELPARTRAKRLRGYYNTEYRELLNRDINDAAARSIRNEYEPLPESQMGSSIWTAEEKESFFVALSRLGRDDVYGIAKRIRSKSHLEVREYIHLLQIGLSDRNLQSKLAIPTDWPATTEISDECNALLELAADAISSRQERYEEEVEKKKWGDSWLLDSDIINRLEKQRKADGEEKAIGEALLAASLFNLKNWFELSEEVFMNSAAPQHGDNWRSLIEAEETPAIRATAIEDFYSLVVDTTKKLVSTTLFVTMSRERATGAKKIKHAEINTGDVNAAIKILKMKNNSKEFWAKAARRNNLLVIDEDTSSGIDNEEPMPYNEVEAALGSLMHPRSQSTSRLPTPEPSIKVLDGENSDDFHSADESLYSSGPEDQADISLSDSEFSRSRPGTHSKRMLDQVVQERTQEKYREAFDKEASQQEELRLWKLLKLDPPFQIKMEPLEEPNRSKLSRRNVHDDGDWRQSTEFWSQWEMMEKPVAEEEFERNRRRGRRKVIKAIQEVALPTSSAFVHAEDLTSLEGSEDVCEENESISSGEEREGGEDQAVQRLQSMEQASNSSVTAL